MNNNLSSDQLLLVDTPCHWAALLQLDTDFLVLLKNTLDDATTEMMKNFKTQV